MALCGNVSDLSSCKQTTSGDVSLSQRRRTGSRPLTPLTLKVAIFMARLYLWRRRTRQVNDKGLLAVANECFTGSTLRAVLASRVSEAVGNGALIGVLCATSKKAPRGRGRRRGARRAFV